MKPPITWMPPWIRAWRAAKYRLHSSGLVCWVRGHRLITDGDYSARGTRRLRRKMCSRGCGVAAPWIWEVRERGGNWREISPNGESAFDWLGADPGPATGITGIGAVGDRRP